MIEVKVLLFASFKEILGESELFLRLEQVQTVDALCKVLSIKGANWQEIFANSSSKLKVAVNQELVNFDHRLEQGDEVAFFPPVTGG